MTVTTRSIYHEYSAPPDVTTPYRKAFCWDCSKQTYAKGGTFCGKQPKRFTCAACLEVKAARKKATA